MRRPRFTAVPHEVIDQHMAELSHAELKVLLIVLRYTFGWNRNQSEIPMKRIVELSGLGKSSCCEAARSLESKNLISRIKNISDEGGCSATTYFAIFEDEDPPSEAYDAVQPIELPSVPETGQIKEERKSTLEKEEYIETSSEPTGEDRPALIKEFWSDHRKARGKANWQKKPEFNQWMSELSESDAEIRQRWRRFLADDYWRRECFPPNAFMRAYHRYAADAVMPKKGKFDINNPSDWKLAGDYNSFVDAYRSTGAEPLDSDFEKAFSLWADLSLADQSKAIERVATCDPAFIKSPRNYLKDREFDRKARPEPKGKFESILENA